MYPSLIVAHLFYGAVVASDCCRPLPRRESLPVGAYVAHQVRRESCVWQGVSASGVLECAAVAVFVSGHGLRLSALSFPAVKYSMSFCAFGGMRLSLIQIFTVLTWYPSRYAASASFL